MKSIQVASALALSSMLVACGGGGGTDPNQPNNGSSGSNGGAATAATTTLVASTVVGVDIINLASTPTVFKAAHVYDGPTFSNIKSLSNFTLNDGTGRLGSQYEMNMTGVSAGTFYEGAANNENTSFSVGGTTWSYSRFGLFSSTGLTVVQGTSTRVTPFFVANVFSPATLADATYANGSAVGELVAGGHRTKIKCDASVVYKRISIDGPVLTLSKCLRLSNNGIPIDVPVTGTIYLPIGGGYGHKGFTIDGVGFPVVVGAGEVKFGGPTGEELVGAVTVGELNKSYFTFAFGAKK